MEKNCIVRTLLTNVQDESLQKRGFLKIKRVYLDNEGGSNIRAALKINNASAVNITPMKLTIIGDGEFFSDSARTTSLGKEVSFNDLGTIKTYYTSNGNYDIEIESKYGAYSHSELYNAFQIKVEDLYYTRFTRFIGNAYIGELKDVNGEIVTRIQSNNIYGKLTDLTKILGLTHIKVARGNMEIGDFDCLGVLKQLTETEGIIARGTIESFVIAQRKKSIVDGVEIAGRKTSTAINFPYLGSNKEVTFNGELIPNGDTCNISWTASTITVVVLNGGTERLNLTINNSEGGGEDE